MPLLWRYLLRNYIQVFCLSVVGFISVLLVTRFQTIARFAATGASKLYVLKFVVFQIPFILPLAIPVSCLIASFLIFQRMSRSHELTAIRVAGLSLFPISFPLIACGTIIALLNFTMISEATPKCRALSKNLAYEMTAINPLCLLQKDTLIRLKNTYVDMKILKSGKYAEDVCFIMRNLTNQRLGLMLAKKISLENQSLIGDGVSFISAIDPKHCDCFDHLVIENQAKMQTQSDHLAQYLRSSDWNFNYDYLNLRMLQAKGIVEFSQDSGINTKAIQEISRRLSLGLAALIFTLVGIVFGIETQRGRNFRGVLSAAALMAFYLISFAAAKSMKHSWIPSTSLYLLPHAVILFICLRGFKQIARGTR